jgi:hypothetical protein
MPRTINRNRVIICVMLLFACIQTGATGGFAQAGPSPVLASAISSVPLAQGITIQGEGFSPGGLVYVVFYDRWGATVHDHVWAVASGATYGANGSSDPAQGYSPGGKISDRLPFLLAPVYGANGSADPAQGYAASSSALSAQGMTEPVFGQNGSQDPAQGYSPAGLASSDAVACGRDLMVRAYDTRANAWSNLVDVTAGC